MDIAEDVKRAAMRAFNGIDYGEKSLVGRIELVIQAERERCAKVADGMFDTLYGEPGLQASYERSILSRLASSIRSGAATE